MLPPFSITLKVVKALEECGIQYLVGGSLCSSIHGIPRATLDADLVSNIETHQVSLLVEKLQAEFYIDSDMILDAIKNRSCFNIIHLDTMFKVDVFILKNNSYQQEEFSRRKPKILPNFDETVNLASPEDIILNKLLWYKEGGEVSERQWEDAKGVFKVQGKLLDLEYLQHWANGLGIGDLLAKIQTELGK